MYSETDLVIRSPTGHKNLVVSKGFFNKKMTDLARFHRVFSFSLRKPSILSGLWHYCDETVPINKQNNNVDCIC